MPHKVGLHLLHHPEPDRIIPLIEKLRPAVIKSLGSAAYLADLADRLRDVLDYEPTFVARLWWEGIGTPDDFQPLQNNATIHAYGQVDYSPARAYDRWRSQIRPELEAMIGRDNFYVESFNEVGISREYLQFERERTARLRLEYGLRSLVGNLAVGWSTLGHFEMARDVGLIHTLRIYGGAWGEHGYGSVLGLQMYHGPT